MTSAPPTLIFAADVHWQAGDADPTGPFGGFLAALADRARAGADLTLYILGDLFDFWHERAGNAFAFYAEHLAALRATVEAGVPIRVLFGNRDFSYRRALQRATGAEVRGDRDELNLNGHDREPHRLLLVHGDQLCTRDHRYQAYRRVIRSRPLRTIMGLIPMSFAAKLARGMRNASEYEVARKGDGVTGIVDDAVAAEHAKGFATVICGHIHRPGRRSVTGAPDGAELITLGAWEKGEGSYVEYDGATFTLRRHPGDGEISVP
jgi:UDP-2,3-diacylglucosamine hydrolase